MKKIIYLFGIVALLTACGGNKAEKGPDQHDDMEMKDHDHDAMEETMPEDTMMEMPADTATTPPIQ
jgi:hypothetical protein